jgi:hypothetical protein
VPTAKSHLSQKKMIEFALIQNENFTSIKKTISKKGKREKKKEKNISCVRAQPAAE